MNCLNVTYDRVALGRTLQWSTDWRKVNWSAERRRETKMLTCIHCKEKACWEADLSCSMFHPILVLVWMSERQGFHPQSILVFQHHWVPTPWLLRLLPPPIWVFPFPSEPAKKFSSASLKCWWPKTVFCYSDLVASDILLRSLFCPFVVWRLATVFPPLLFWGKGCHGLLDLFRMLLCKTSSDWRTSAKRRAPRKASYSRKGSLSATNDASDLGFGIMFSGDFSAGFFLWYQLSVTVI